LQVRIGVRLRATLRNQQRQQQNGVYDGGLFTGTSQGETSTAGTDYRS